MLERGEASKQEASKHIGYSPKRLTPHSHERHRRHSQLDWESIIVSTTPKSLLAYTSPLSYQSSRTPMRDPCKESGLQAIRIMLEMTMW